MKELPTKEIREGMKIINGDCMEVMKQYEDNYFDLCIVDPPYGININVSMGRRKGDKKSDYHKFAGNDSSIPSADYFEELRRVSKNQIVWGGNYMTEHLAPSPCWILWDKGFSSEVTFAQFEMAWTSFKSSAKKYNKCPNDPSRIHPTQKPTGLYDFIYSRYAQEGQKILDTHLGSGSNAISAHYAKMGEFVGVELDEDYYKSACERIKKETMQLELF